MLYLQETDSLSLYLAIPACKFKSLYYLDYRGDIKEAMIKLHQISSRTIKASQSFLLFTENQKKNLKYIAGYIFLLYVVQLNMKK